ncbi:hypothetical protein VNO78_08511 [Psophocarpus tetragonolobus]|uniref:Ankyrin repeat domain-containing protein, chloroplastic n=1 Tax=Psophocarpus tetragonolobus TaxID=3891 RepID=A0AAN9SXB2_PSOTE
MEAIMLNPLPLIFPFATVPRRLPTNRNALSQDRHTGDCVVFQDGVFEDDTVFQNDTTKTTKSRSRKKITRDNLVPEKWREAQAETKITIHERRKNKSKKKRREPVPSRDAEVEKKGKAFRDEYTASKNTKLRELNPLVLKNPSRFSLQENLPQSCFTGQRLDPKNPRDLLNGTTLEDVMHFFNSTNYNPSANITPEDRRKLFTITKEELFLLNKRTPDLPAATSDKWLPLHTLAACGEYYLLHSLLKHNVDINAVDKDKEGATLMHYAVQTASTETIELLLLYNVDINLQDKDGWTPLHLAVQTQRPNLVRLLLLKGADKTLRNKDGLTPLDLCLYSGQSFQTYVLIKLLKQPQGCL